MTKKKKNKFTEKELENHKERKHLSYSNMFYSEQRIDLLIIAMSGAGIYVCLETIKFLGQNERPIDTLLKLPGCFLLGAVICNFIGQLLSKRANKHDYLMCICVEEQDDCGAEEHDKKADKFSKAVEIANLISMISMFVGLILLVIYFTTSF
ncbi:hypothetical protein [Fluviicola chungangensis]|uniref:DUF3899 domain-containing protein n=1 Tax=Fluviicola chungangensis TaxID=2597671 RepID=A0A556N602_9FLAO|nr:hypothetical protein [Fluviicola chungangensis]TSJ47614.1 hypothetical protein FO442_00365 [Fluviicola chungangensis]